MAQVAVISLVMRSSIGDSDQMASTQIETAAIEGSIAEDLLTGGHAIAELLFPDDDPVKRRKRLYHFASTMKGTKRPPIFKIGATLCARKSKLMRWVAEQETAASSEAA
jgi:hypothetical protein